MTLRKYSHQHVSVNFYQTFLLILLLLPIQIQSQTSNQANNNNNNNNVYEDMDDMECPNTFWTEIESGCESRNSKNMDGGLKVFEGTETDADRWPYLVSLQRRLTGPFRGCYLHRCGATLIAPNMVLTAAHCLWSPNHDYRHPSIPNVLGVELYAALGPKCRHQVGKGRVKVVRYFISDDYVAESETRGGGDIAILQLDRPLQGGMIANIQGAMDLPLEDKKLTVVGWGDTEADDVSYAIRSLRIGILNFVQDSICEAIMSAVTDGRLTVSGEKEICAYNSAVDSCDGDSGGPLVMADEFGGAEGDPNLDVQVGIVSWGPPGACGQSSRQLVGVYTSINYYLPWIEEIKQEINGLPPVEATNPATGNTTQSSPASQTLTALDPKCTITKSGCQCPQEWTFNSPTVHKGCTNPDGDAGGPWCIITPGSCPQGVKPAGDLTLNSSPTGSQYDYCEVECEASDSQVDEACTITIASCKCKKTWEVVANGGEVFTGCANPDNDPRGNWCHYEDPSCVDEPAGRGWDYCKPGCEKAQLKSSIAGNMVKELNSEWQPKQDCSCEDSNRNLPDKMSCLDAQKLGMLNCKEKLYSNACPCTCGFCRSKELLKVSTELQKG